MAFSGPNIESLLRQIAGVGFNLSKAVSKLIKRVVITRHQTFKIQTHWLLSTVISRTHGEAKCSRKYEGKLIEGNVSWDTKNHRLTQINTDRENKTRNSHRLFVE